MPAKDFSAERAKAHKAILTLGWSKPHFLVVYSKIKNLIKVDESITINGQPTMCVAANGAIRMHPDFINTYSPQILGGALAHEFCHLALDHFNRAKAKGVITTEGKAVDPELAQLWNIAGDWAINDALRTDKIPLPDWVVYPDPAYPSNLPRTTESFFDYLREKREQERQGGSQNSKNGKPDKSQGKVGNGCGVEPADPGQGQGEQPGQGQGDPAEGEGASQDSKGLSQAEISQLGADVRAFAKQIGTGSEGIQRLLAPAEPTIDWKKVVRSGFEMALSTRGLDAPSWSKRSRRSTVGGPILPGWTTCEPKIGLILDVSGSMNDEWREAIMGECQRLAGLYNAKVFWVAHTSKVECSGWLIGKAGADKATKEAFDRSGGTDAYSAYQLVRESGRFDSVIHFTDCELPGSWPESPAKRLIVGALGLKGGEPYCKPPEGATLVRIETPL